MRIRSISLRQHPALGDIDLTLADGDGNIFDKAILAGGNGTGKTAILEAIMAIFEGKLNRRIGTIILDIEVDQETSASIRHTHIAHQIDGMGDIDRIVISLDSTMPAGDWSAYSMSVYAGTASRNISTIVMTDSGFHGVFKIFFSEVSVNFSSKAVSTITAQELDQDRNLVQRSGSQLASQITQLLIDIRAADSEDLSSWVQINPAIAPPPEVSNKRISRFERAFNEMFPAKRFKGITRQGGNLRVEFEENGNISSIDELSTGEKQIVFRAGFLLKNLGMLANSIILIDEPELGLHPEWQSSITSFYSSLASDENGKQAQIIMATHSPFVVHGAANTAVIILEKNPQTGVIREMPQPTYPSVQGYEAVRAFNIDGFLETAKQPLLVLTEGESDALIIKTAWEKLRPGKARQFELRAALGKKNINISLNDSELPTKLGSRMIVGLFDFDEAYNDWNGVWKKQGASSVVQADVKLGLLKKHATFPGWAMLLPVPSHRNTYASESLKGDSIMSIEYLFDDSILHSRNMISSKNMPLGNSIPKIVESKKSNFAEFCKSLSASDFQSLEPILATFEHIISDPHS